MIQLRPIALDDRLQAAEAIVREAGRPAEGCEILAATPQLVDAVKEHVAFDRFE